MEKTFKLPEGAKIKMVDTENNLVIYEEKEPEFKRGDFLILKRGADSLEAIYDDDMGSEWYSFLIDGTFNLNSCIYKLQARLMTDTEKSNFIKKMNDNGWDWDSEKLEVVPYVWKPKYQETYFSIYLSENDKPYAHSFTGTKFDLDHVKYGFACQTQKEAFELHDAIVEFVKEWRMKR
jgi:hypothetical protein